MFEGTRSASARQAATAVLLILCISVVALWEIMANRSRRPFDPFEISTSDFETFSPRLEKWTVERLAVDASPIEPNILVFVLRPRAGVDGPESVTQPVQVRLVHGYNMPECMQIKHYEIDLLDDRREDPLAPGDVRLKPPPAGVPQHQVWRLTSQTKDTSVWITSMLRAGDFRSDHIDVRSMTFPRVGTPDDPRFVPEGLSAKSLKHPIRNFRWLMRAKWNNARCDPLTFLRLRQPSWASNEILTLVSNSSGSPRQQDEQEVAAHVLAAHTAMFDAFRQWRKTMLKKESGE